MYFPWLRKKLRKKREAAAARTGAAHPAALKSVGKAAPRLAKTIQAVAEARASQESNPAPVLPDEGVRAVETVQPMKAVERRRLSPRKRELRRALILGEILAPKF